MFRRCLLPVLLTSLLSACGLVRPVDTAERAATAGDPHSYADISGFRTRHVALDLTVDFSRRRLSGSATLDLQRLEAKAQTLILDTRDLDIVAVEAGDRHSLKPTSFTLGARDAILGSPLRIAMPAGADRVRIRYATRPEASGLQWLTAQQTADKKHPFLFTQSQAIHARSWIPLQDTPQVRVTYDARIRTPKALLAVMGAENELPARRDGDYRFRMPQPIPSYLFALAVGDLEFRAIGARTGVYAERSVVKAAAKEFEDTEKMLVRSEALFGPYRWGRYDLLILPPSFPYGGMENPRLTFASPTVIAGDKSLVSLVAHELAHSWSGNLVTNAVWDDFWLNEGFTNHLTFRIMEEIYGRELGQQERALGARDLKAALEAQSDPRDRTLAPRLAGRDPDDNVTDVPYERGALFLAYLEAKFGRVAFDAFLRGWFDERAFQSTRTADFLRYLDRELLSKQPGVVSDAKIHEWIYSPQMPADTVWPRSDAFTHVDAQREAWLAGRIDSARLDTRGWSSRQWQYFFDELPTGIGQEKLVELDETFRLTGMRNAVIASRWYRVALANDYSPVYPAIDGYLRRIGRMLLIRPIYQELAKTEDGRAFAREIFAEARAGYHPIAQDAMAKILDAETPADAAAKPSPAVPKRPVGPRPGKHPFQTGR